MHLWGMRNRAFGRPGTGRHTRDRRLGRHAVPTIIASIIARLLIFVILRVTGRSVRAIAPFGPIPSRAIKLVDSAVASALLVRVVTEATIITIPASVLGEEAASFASP